MVEEKQETKHTPTPWEVGEADLGLWITGPDRSANVICDLMGRGAEGYPVMLTDEDFENARLIVRAVNNHKAFEDALRAIVGIAGNLTDEAVESVAGINDARSRALMVTAARKIARAALASIDSE